MTDRPDAPASAPTPDPSPDAAADPVPHVEVRIPEDKTEAARRFNGDSFFNECVVLAARHSRYDPPAILEGEAADALVLPKSLLGIPDGEPVDTGDTGDSDDASSWLSLLDGSENDT